MRLITCFAVCFGIACLSGCGDDGPPMGTVSGIVKVGGAAPTEKLKIQFFNGTTGAGASGDVAEDGSYELTAPVPVGEYNVFFSKDLGAAAMQGAVSTAQETAESIPAEYRRETGSPLNKKVEEGSNTINIEVPKA